TDFLYFYFQAEDGIRDFHVTGVQTCALPIFALFEPRSVGDGVGINGASVGQGVSVAEGVASAAASARPPQPASISAAASITRMRSEERRVGKERKSRCAADHCKTTNHQHTTG